MTIVGSGDFKYELVPDWPRMPRYWKFGMATDAAVNSNDEILVFNRGLHPLTIWDKVGNFITSWGEGEFTDFSHGICVAPNDNVWLVDASLHTVTEWTPGGELLRTFGNKRQPADTWNGFPFNMPTGLSISPKGDIFVSDGYAGHNVHKFNAKGERIMTWGSQGTQPGQFSIVHAVWVDRFNRVYICDRENNRIQVFDENGGYLKQWSGISHPADMWIKDDFVYVVEQFKPCGIVIMTLDGEVITGWRGEEGQGKGTLVHPHGICVDSEGSLYVTEIVPVNRVQKFVRV